MEADTAIDTVDNDEADRKKEEPIRVLIGASSAILRSGLEAMIRQNPRFESVGGLSFSEALARSAELRPRVLLLATDDPVGSEGPLRAALGDNEMDVPVALLADSGRSALALEWFPGKIRAALPLNAAERQLSLALEAVAQGLIAAPPEFIEAFASAPYRPSGPGGPAITPRETEILHLMSEGSGNREIAWQLGISEHTVKFHIGSIFEKLDAASRTEAVTQGIRHGLIML